MLLIILLHGISCIEQGKTVSVSVKSVWPEVPLYEQVLAFTNEMSASSMKAVLLDTLDSSVDINNETQILSVITRHLSPEMMKLLQLHIDNGALVPKVLAASLSKGKVCEDLLDSDYVHIERGELVTADLRNESEKQKVISLLRSDTPFVLRVSPKLNASSSILKGYGVEMRPFKYSMEYGGANSRKISNIKEDELLPQKFTEMLIQKENASLDFLSNLTSNWPDHILDLMDIKPSQMSFMATQMMSGYIYPGRVFSSIGGRVMEPEVNDIFTILNAINSELRIRQHEGSIENIAKKSIYSENLIEGFDKFSYFLNDLTKDKQYQGYESNASLLKEWERGIPTIKLNLVKSVLFVDPSKFSGLQQVFMSLIAIRKGVPIQFGLVPMFDMGNPVSRKMAFAFHHLALKNERVAFDFLIRLFKEEIETEEIPENIIEKVYTVISSVFKALPWSHLHQLYTPDSPEYQRISATMLHNIQLKIPKNHFVANGLLRETIPNPKAYLYVARKAFMDLASAMDGDETNFDPMRILSRKFYVTKTAEEEVVQGLGLYESNLNKQTKYGEYLSQFGSESTILAFTNDTQHMKNLQRFSDLKHIRNTSIQINPKLPRDIYDVKQSDLPLMIYDGRVYKSFDFSLDSLVNAEKWSEFKSHRFVDGYVIGASKHIMMAILCDWREQGIKRDSLQQELTIFEAPTVIRAGKGNITWEIISNPFSTQFQRMIPVVKAVSELVKITLFLNPGTGGNLRDPALASFYRSTVSQKRVQFDSLDPTTTYSILADFPQTWFYETLSASFDIDNVKIDELTEGNHEAIFVVTDCVFEGFLETLTSNAGATLLVDGKESRVLGYRNYFQSPVTPGLVSISLADNTKIATVNVNSFAYNPKTIIFPHITKLPEPPAIASNISSVNVFAVASGYTYERLLKIMMLSVTRHTKWPAKFWILKNFVSPSLKATLPSFSLKNGFTYEFIQYKWPIWVTKQSEKQRIVWGNKILFLDTLFPRDVKRVVYVDADQIVRTDMRQLMELDMNGRVYGFTPFCDSRKETEPYRFWKTGFWKDYLRGLPYHISALFVTDLDRFRETNAGDILRGTYNGLSEDENSLANLDQDLPNYLQHKIPIFSLPRDWLWCETWCADEDMDKAKTIDLCNNPLTKIPKIDIARERVREWPALDREAAESDVDPVEFEKNIFNTRR